MMSVALLDTRPMDPHFSTTSLSTCHQRARQDGNEPRTASQETPEYLQETTELLQGLEIIDQTVSTVALAFFIPEAPSRPTRGR